MMHMSKSNMSWNKNIFMNIQPHGKTISFLNTLLMIDIYSHQDTHTVSVFVFC